LGNSKNPIFHFHSLFNYNGYLGYYQVRKTSCFGTSYDPADTFSIGANTTLYAIYTTPAPITYTVTYDANGGTGNLKVAGLGGFAEYGYWSFSEWGPSGVLC
jgi:hypothetical protein